ncbi:UNVERIFIED_CONTAM: hypothetical protein PYX00_010971 [Menopon gallinae]|uniref:Tyr recombinase domain-containing protein n=1 Tax=Menopon gallinae TaxID=328185 RepID=A0AAW2H6W4_9NEOP
MGHRKVLQELAKEGLAKKGIFLALWEGGTYEEDLKRALVSFRIPQSRKELFKAQQTTSLRAKNRTLKPIPFSLEDLDKFLSNLFSSEDLLDHAIAFLLSTGRRSEELLRGGEFKALKRDWMRLNNPAKKRGKGRKTDFPVLWDSEVLLGLVAQIAHEDLSSATCSEADIWVGMNDIADQLRSMGKKNVIGLKNIMDKEGLKESLNTLI